MCCPPSMNLNCPKKTLNTSCILKEDHINEKPLQSWLKGFIIVILLVLGSWALGGFWIMKKIENQFIHKGISSPHN